MYRPVHPSSRRKLLGEVDAEIRTDGRVILPPGLPSSHAKKRLRVEMSRAGGADIRMRGASAELWKSQVPSGSEEQRPGLKHNLILITHYRPPKTPPFPGRRGLRSQAIRCSKHTGEGQVTLVED
ncbi:hypothetical protein SKAU_G00166820 [Synaphobranchus kaupii]|uniref:Uncharacterized protein n=1 Tax=Synaphobranchus kaupii TaxID=118154 RepID=A0A9Q1FJL9_SYNKA|nr:hypothetical protein SKAU_G00166820 [Synaphobranchus kaupii]